MRYASSKYLLLALAIAVQPSCFAHAADTANKRSYDVRFLDTMSDHHRDGIAMMKMAVQKAHKEEIKQMAQKGIDDQATEITQMQKVRSELGGNQPTAPDTSLPGMMPESKMENDMEKLEAASGTHFDQHFLEIMSEHHQGAVEMSDDALENASSSEVKKFAQEIHDKQKSEIEMMQAMLKDMK